MDRIQKSGLKLNKSKCAFRLNQVKYWGHIFSDKAVKADPSKIEAITSMPGTPESPADLHRFLGMVQYLAKSVPNLASTVFPRFAGALTQAGALIKTDENVDSELFGKEKEKMDWLYLVYIMDVHPSTKLQKHRRTNYSRL